MTLRASSHSAGNRVSERRREEQKSFVAADAPDVGKTDFLPEKCLHHKFLKVYDVSDMVVWHVNLQVTGVEFKKQF